MKKTIAVLAGDGIGPEVMAVTIPIMDQIAKKFSHQFSYQNALIGGAAYDKYQHHFPDETRIICEKADAILFGSVGGPIAEMGQPKWQNCEKNSILGLRKNFHFSANYRPVKMYPELESISPLKSEIIRKGVDILIIRELVGDLYFGEHKTEIVDGQRKSFDVMEYDEKQIRSIAHAAFKASQLRRRRVVSVDKSNVLDCSKLWKTVVTEVHAEYSDVSLDHILVDNCAMQLIRNPGQFDVLLCPNMFGDILSDEAAVIPGSLGLMPSASLNEQGFGLYEPAGGSAPDIAGKNIANPIAQILSAAMMLRHSFALEEEAMAIEDAVGKTIADGKRTGDIADAGQKTLSTHEMGKSILERI